jgi:hypothetical protein
MAAQLRCGTRMDGSGPGTVFSSLNRGLRPDFAMLSACPPAPTEGVCAAAIAETPAEHDSPEAGRGALPAGHPLSWGLLTAGTVLDGAPYFHIP